jgi:hypothetical protein
MVTISPGATAPPLKDAAFTTPDALNRIVDAWILTVASLVLVGSAKDTAVMVTLAALARAAGGVYTPDGEMLPTGGVTDQRTPVLLALATWALN